MNLFDLIRLILYFFICNAANWSWLVAILLLVTELLWYIEYNSTLRDIEIKYDEAAKRNIAIEKRNSQVGTKEPHVGK